ncbi:alpha-galactosidase [Micromonospora sp. NPDC000089]|uniref:alpha-galactosidase n=1 Tax=unclassified Micromonospora TaxID=2617518 RepID=UPI00368AA1D9
MIIQLRAAGTSFVLDARGPGAPVVLHWGPDLGALGDGDLATLADAAGPAVAPSSLDEPLRLSMLPTLDEGWSGRPAIAGWWPDDGTPVSGFRLLGVRHDGPERVLLDLAATDGRIQVTTEVELSEHGVLRIRHHLRHTGSGTFQLSGLDVLLPMPREARELLDFSGLWAYERQPQRTTLRHGVWSRETRHGRPGHDDPYLMMAGTPGFDFRAGRVWATHLAWSGDKRLWAERHALGYGALGAGELLAPGELSLRLGEHYTTPWTVAVFSDAGIDGLSARLHPWIRSRRPPRAPRPVVLNTWEAVYFDHDRDTLDRLVDTAAEVGVERFVLDDGWFSGRTDDRRALGDWYVDEQRWPKGLHALIDRVHQRGMDFGLWVEPEMVSPDSALARDHPDWVLGGVGGPTWRYQRVLDLGQPGAYAHVLDRLTALLTEYPIAFLKWDHNRDLLQAGAAHRQTKALYRLLVELRTAFPSLEIESCASGGARIDLGILELVDRVWTSDNNDPLERQRIQRWTGVLVPPEFLGGHLGAPTAELTGRTSALGFRFVTALFGSAGIEWDLTRATAAERAAVADWVAAYKRLRPLLHGGVVVRSGGDGAAQFVHGVVDADRRTGIFALVALQAADSALPDPIRFGGLDPDRHYSVRPLPVGPAARVVQDAAPAWLRSGSVTMSGRVLAEVGLPAPLLTPEQATLFSVEAR